MSTKQTISSNTWKILWDSIYNDVIMNKKTCFGNVIVSQTSICNYHTLMYLNWYYLNWYDDNHKILTIIGIMVRVFANGSRDLGLYQRLKKWYLMRPGLIPKLKKWYLMPPYLTLSIIRYGSWVKWVNPEKGVAPSPTPWCSSYQKESLQVTLNYACQRYLLYF